MIDFTTTATTTTTTINLFKVDKNLQLKILVTYILQYDAKIAMPKGTCQSKSAITLKQKKKQKVPPIFQPRFTFPQN